MRPLAAVILLSLPLPSSAQARVQLALERADPETLRVIEALGY